MTEFEVIRNALERITTIIVAENYIETITNMSFEFDNDGNLIRITR